MSVPLFTPLDDDLAKYGELVSVEAFHGITEALNYLIDSMPIGSIVPMLVGIPGMPTLDPRLWQVCEGGMITEQRSELHDNAAPDLRNRYMKGADLPGLAGFTGGSNTRSFSHNHGGVTQFNPIGGDNSDTDDDYITIYSHTHPISADLTSTINIEPRHFRVLHYIKIA